MKVCVQNTEIFLKVYGHEKIFSEDELIAMVKEHLVPAKKQWFKVNPLAIDQKLFKEKRKDLRQESTRQLIIEAFSELKNNPEKYGKKFKTMIPKKIWKSKTVTELIDLANRLGDHNADWVEQALEWAQRIANGESWESICNHRDTANSYRLIVWKNGHARIVGGASNGNANYPPSIVFSKDYNLYDIILYNIVPLVVLYEEE